MIVIIDYGMGNLRSISNKLRKIGFESVHTSVSLYNQMESIFKDRNDELILYCQGGFRSALAADNLLNMGYENPASLAGGFGDWMNNGFNIETED